MAEPEEHARLLELEAAVGADVEAFGACPLADKARVTRLSAGLQDKLSRHRALTRDLELLVEELDSDDEERQPTAALLAAHKAEYERLQAGLRAAALAQRTTALRSAADERRELLAGGDAGLRQRRAQREADAVQLAEDVTGGLRRTRQVLAEELEHTSATLAAMEQSHGQLGRTRDEYHGQHRHLRRSRGLLGTLSWQAKSDTYMLWIGLALFLLVCGYVGAKRAGYFVPDRLKPASLRRGGARPAPGPQPLSAPRVQSPPPGLLRRDDGGAGGGGEGAHRRRSVPPPVEDEGPGKLPPLEQAPVEQQRPPKQPQQQQAPHKQPPQEPPQQPEELEPLPEPEPDAQQPPQHAASEDKQQAPAAAVGGEAAQQQARHEEPEPAVAPEGGPEPGDAAGAAAAPVEQAASSETGGSKHNMADRQGRRIAVDGPGFVHEPPPPHGEAEGQEEGVGEPAIQEPVAAPAADGAKADDLAAAVEQPPAAAAAGEEAEGQAAEEAPREEL